MRALDYLRSSSPARTTGDIESDESVAAEQKRSIFDQQHATAGGVAVRMDNARSRWHVEDYSVGKLIEASNRRRASDPLCHVAQDVGGIPRAQQEASHADVAQVLLTAQVVLVCWMREDPRP